MNIKDTYDRVYFLGIGGIGMSALARWFRHLGWAVAGYDRTPSQLTAALAAEGIAIHYTDLAEKVQEIAGDRTTTLVVVTPALPPDHGEWNWLRTNGFTILKRSQVLGMLCNPGHTIAVAGTHGKTTVSTMAAVILSHRPQGCGAFLGGISRNFGSNLLLPSFPEAWIVTEADEYDRSFLQLTPEVAVITYMDPDHLDVYGNDEDFQASFLEFAGGIKPGGSLVVRRELASRFGATCGRKIYTYALTGEADFSTRELTLDPQSRCYSFRIVTPSGESPLMTMGYPGLHNVENGVAAAAAAFLAGASLEEIINGLEAYTGVARRFDIRYRSPHQIFIDDYAHHPRELHTFITSVRHMWPGKKITGIFQPHLYTRTRDFAEAFANSLDLLDTAVVIPIYPAREQPIAGVSPELILSKMTLTNKLKAEKEEIIPFLRKHPPEILVTMGAGDIELMADELIAFLTHEADR
jgi:UDP-N-acetylmuramate--alanine ligase